MTRAEPAAGRPSRLGIGENSYCQRRKPEAGTAAHPPFTSAIDLMTHASQLNASGVQVSVAGWDARMASEVKALAEKRQLALEGSITLPKDRGDVVRFAAEVNAFAAAGGRIARTVTHGGRRYEEFDALAPYQAWWKLAQDRVRMAEAACRKAGVVLAIENHKDVRIEDLLGLVRALSSRFIGICLDTGNSIALCEDPAEIVEAYAPHAVSCHLKDMAMAATDEGFLMSEVPLGTGCLDLPAMVARIRKANPEILFSLEMITRDPLVIPVLTPRYWATMPGVAARDLGRTLALVRRQQRATPLPAISDLGPDATLAFEEKNVTESLTYARQTLGL